MGDVANPVIPVWFDIVWSAAAVIAIALTVVALIVLARTAKRLPLNHALIWTMVVLFVPVLGPIAWLAIGNRAISPEYNN
ncbi:PLDc N-terminal domain-containing protein [Agromyces aureus]|uniref:Cardiolipin synthase N-terminal domain-containing protein n=1 Tax=Agromyces aureus TaxID=453304 RepID=A0A191WGH2_9MICO|nr:PLDc N-terminal domain-containing protein [Agromyces aureus]ANJ27356.1 hypothetical protein ATC03_12135 [Agromyces aureus]